MCVCVCVCVCVGLISLMLVSIQARLKTIVLCALTLMSCVGLQMPEYCMHSLDISKFYVTLRIAKYRCSFFLSLYLIEEFRYSWTFLTSLNVHAHYFATLDKQVLNLTIYFDFQSNPSVMINNERAEIITFCSNAHKAWTMFNVQVGLCPQSLNDVQCASWNDVPRMNMLGPPAQRIANWCMPFICQLTVTHNIGHHAADQ